MFHVIENPVVKETTMYDWDLPFRIVGERRDCESPPHIDGNDCGCGRTAKYLVHDHKQPHCTDCMLEAVDCEEQTLVRRM